MKLCKASHNSGWQCELQPGHGGEHRGGDYCWSGTDRMREQENEVLREILAGEIGKKAIISRTGMTKHVVSRCLRALFLAGLIDRLSSGGAVTYLA